jgi:hypothetical protein
MIESRNNGEYHRADPAYRKQMKVWLAVTVIVGSVCLVALNIWLNHLATTLGASDPGAMQTWLQRVLAGICLLLAAGSAGFAIWVYRLAKLTRQERRWPPSQMSTTQDVRIRYLTSADALVSQFMAGVFALALFALVMAGWAIWLLRSA